MNPKTEGAATAYDFDLPPEACIDDAQCVGEIPALWNPGAAVLWSLLFTPLFGAILHLRNWEALGERPRIARATAWLSATAVMTPLSITIGQLGPVRGSDVTCGILLIWLIIWYFASARHQVRFMKERFGADYPRRGWRAPLFAAAGVVVLSWFCFALALVMGMD